MEAYEVYRANLKWSQTALRGRKDFNVKIYYVTYRFDYDVESIHPLQQSKKRQGVLNTEMKLCVPHEARLILTINGRILEFAHRMRKIMSNINLETWHYRKSKFRRRIIMF